MPFIAPTSLLPHTGPHPLNKTVLGTEGYFTPLLLQTQEEEEQLGLEN